MTGCNWSFPMQVSVDTSAWGFKWAQKYGLLNDNPYEGMANDMPKYPS
jgi:hypothetical protein